MAQCSINEAIVFRRTGVERLLPLRHRELRAGLAFEAARFEADDEPSTFHFGAFLGEENIGCASFMLNGLEGEPAYQLRGMATRADLAGCGIGRALLAFALRTLRDETAVRRLWCNARVPAVGFYQKQGWAVVSDLFQIPTAGPHYRMTRML